MWAVAGTARASPEREMKMTKERPILFNSEMVRAILDDRKTMTRRVLKPQPIWGEEQGLQAVGWKWKTKKVGLSAWPDIDDFLCELGQHCPYGKVGDLLWCKETWMLYNHMGTFTGSIPKQPPKDLYVGYKADGLDKDNLFSWRPSIFMPKWAAHIWRENVSIGVERMEGEYYLYADEILESGIVTARKIINPWAWVIEFKKINHN